MTIGPPLPLPLQVPYRVESTSSISHIQIRFQGPPRQILDSDGRTTETPPKGRVKLLKFQ